jgi:hypothetical protein
MGHIPSTQAVLIFNQRHHLLEGSVFFHIETLDILLLVFPVLICEEPNIPDLW